MKDNTAKYREIAMLAIGTFLIFLSLFLIMYDRFELVKNEVIGEVELAIYNETHQDEEVVEEESQEVEVETEEVEEEPPKEEQPKKPTYDYIGFLEIPKLNQKNGFLSKTSKYNNVNKNIQILTTSDYPDVKGGHTIIAGHSGNSSVSFFKNLYKLKLGDEAYIYYKNYMYKYRIIEIFTIPKTGKYAVKRVPDITQLTLITCTKNVKTTQTIYILELYTKLKTGSGN